MPGSLICLTSNFPLPALLIALKTYNSGKADYIWFYSLGSLSFPMSEIANNRSHPRVMCDATIETPEDIYPSFKIRSRLVSTEGFAFARNGLDEPLLSGINIFSCFFLSFFF